MSSKGTGFRAMAVALISLLIGMVLGQRFKVLALVPAMAVVVLIAVGAGVARGAGVWPTILMVVVAMATVQIGYLAGIAIRSLLAAGRASKLHATFETGARQPVSRHAQ
jgi:predicted Na+-dependent transporter